MNFTKMHGIGNDYVYINCFEETVENPNQLAKLVSDRHFGIGSDGLVLICPSNKADFEMKMFNADGSQAQMCGNAIRCVGKYVYERGLTKKTTVTIDTLAGIKTLELVVDPTGCVCNIRVNMGTPILTPGEIPVHLAGDKIIRHSLDVNGVAYEVTCVSMGNPHAVVYMDDIDNLDIEKIGPLFENHPAFPQRINTEFVEVIDRKTLKMRVWERGAGETWACGTGACAVLVASVLCSVSDREAVVRLRGGDLKIEWSEKDNCVYKTGGATFVFDGQLLMNLNNQE